MLTAREKKMLVACYRYANGEEFDCVNAGQTAGFTSGEAEDLAILLANKGLFDGLGYESSTALFTPEGREMARSLIEEEDAAKVARRGWQQIIPKNSMGTGGSSAPSIQMPRPSAVPAANGESLDAVAPSVGRGNHPSQPVVNQEKEYVAGPSTSRKPTGLLIGLVMMPLLLVLSGCAWWLWRGDSTGLLRSFLMAPLFLVSFSVVWWLWGGDWKNVRDNILAALLCAAVSALVTFGDQVIKLLNAGGK